MSCRTRSTSSSAATARVAASSARALGHVDLARASRIERSSSASAGWTDAGCLAWVIGRPSLAAGRSADGGQRSLRKRAIGHFRSRRHARDDRPQRLSTATPARPYRSVHHRGAHPSPPRPPARRPSRIPSRPTRLGDRAADPSRVPARRRRRPASTGVAATVAACTAAGAPAVELRAPAAPRPPSGASRGVAGRRPSRHPPPVASRRRPRRPRRRASAPRPRASRRAGPSTTSPPANVVRRYVGNLAPGPQGRSTATRRSRSSPTSSAVEDDYPGAAAAKPAFVQVPQLVLSRRPDAAQARDRRRVARSSITIDEIEQQIDELQAAGRRASATTARWPGPTIRVNQGDKVRAIFTNNLKETTGVHFHGVEFDDFFQDGVPFVTQKPIAPGETYTYEFTAEPAGLADVPLAPQRHRPGRSRPARRVHRRPAEADAGRRVRPRVRLDLERRRWAASRSTATASRPSCRSWRRSARRC